MTTFEIDGIAEEITRREISGSGWERLELLVEHTRTLRALLYQLVPHVGGVGVAGKTADEALRHMARSLDGGTP